MNVTTRTKTSAINREIIDDQKDRLSIHTHRIHLTQANLPYQAVAGKRLASEKHFAVYADQIVLDGSLQNPGRNIELNAREIIVANPTTLDTAGAYADKDFPPGDLPVQKDPMPGAAGTDGADSTIGGDSGSIIICAQKLLNHTNINGELSVVDVSTVGNKVFAEHTSKAKDLLNIGQFEVARMVLIGDKVHIINLEDGRVEGLSNIQFDSCSYDHSGSQVQMRFSFPKLTISGAMRKGASQRMTSKVFGYKVDISAAISTNGAISSLENTPLFTAGAGFDFFKSVGGSGLMPSSVLNKVNNHLSSTFQKQILEPLLIQFHSKLQSTPLRLLAKGGRGGRGQDGNPGNQGESGANGAKPPKPIVVTRGGAAFPDAARGQKGGPGGRAGSPGLSATGGTGGQIVLNVIDSVELAIVYSTEGGQGGSLGKPGKIGPGGEGGKGAWCAAFDSKTGKPVDDVRAPGGKTGNPGAPAKGKGSAGMQGSAGGALQFNGNDFASNKGAYYSFDELAQMLSLSQLLITQNTIDLDFINAKEEAELSLVASGYGWLININTLFTDDRNVVDPELVPTLEQAVRSSMYNSAVVSLMRIQQGLDFYGHSYNWTPVLTLNNLVNRTSQIISLGKVIEDQYYRYLDTARNNKTRMQAFKQAKQEIDNKLGDFDAEIRNLESQTQIFQTEVKEYSEDMMRQRTVLLQGQLEFQDELVKYLRKKSELGLDQFLDMLGTVIGCVGGVVGAAGGIKTAFDAVKKAEEFSKQAKNVVEIFKKAKAAIGEISKAYSSIKDYIDEANPNAAKILVDADDFDDMLDEYLGEFDAAGELRKAIDYYLELSQARNMAAYNYTGLVAQLLSLMAQRDQLHKNIVHINTEIASHQDNVLPIYTAFLKDAYEDVQRDLLRNIYQETRAYRYWSLQERDNPQTSNLNIATQTATHQRLIFDIDRFRENNESFSPFNQKIIISAMDYPNEFAAMLDSRSLSFGLDIHNQPEFLNFRYIIARSFTLKFPEIVDDSHVLYLNLIHSGRALLNSNTDLDKPGAIHVFSHQPRFRIYKIDYRDRDNTAGGNFGEGDQGYIGLSPFTNWRLDFDLKGNEWLDLEKIRTIELTFEGRMLGPGQRMR